MEVHTYKFFCRTIKAEMLLSLVAKNIFIDYLAKAKEKSADKIQFKEDIDSAWKYYNIAAKLN